MSRQEATYRCECGHLATVERHGDSPYEFLATCAACERSTLLSWRQSNPPPTFHGDRAPRLPFRSEDHT